MSAKTAMKWILTDWKALQIPLDCGQNASWKLLEIYQKSYLLIC